MKSHRDLEIWKMSVDLATRIYELTRGFPDHEIFGLRDQMRRAAVSIPSNIAEGAARGSNKDFIRFLHISLGSSAELETQLIIAKNLAYLSDIESVEHDLAAIRRMTVGLIKSLR